LEQLDEIQHLLQGLLWVLVPAVIAVLLAIILGVLLVAKKRLPLVLYPLPVAVPAVCGLVASLLVFWGWDPASVPEETLQAASTVALVRITVFMVTGPICAITPLCCAVAGARYRPRNLSFSGVSAIAVGLCCLLPALGAIDETTQFGLLRTVCYAGLGWMVLLAMMSGGPEEGTGPDAAATAGLSFALLVATGESALKGLFEFFALGALQTAEVDARAETVSNISALLSPEAPFLWATVLLASGAALVGLGVAYRQGRSPSQVGVAALWLVLPLILLWADIGASRMTELALALP
jgi:hypothetical protein